MNTTLCTPPDLTIRFTDVLLEDSEHVRASELPHSIEGVVLVVEFAGFE
jgi:hypothetical protein